MSSLVASGAGRHTGQRLPRHSNRAIAPDHDADVYSDRHGHEDSDANALSEWRVLSRASVRMCSGVPVQPEPDPDSDSDSYGNANLESNSDAHCDCHGKCHSDCNRNCDCGRGLQLAGSGGRSNVHADSNRYPATSGAGSLKVGGWEIDVLPGKKANRLALRPRDGFEPTLKS